MDVDTAGKAAAMAAKGLVTRDLVNNGQPRKQGFFNENGKPIEYDDILFVDGTLEIEKLVGVLEDGTTKAASKTNKTSKMRSGKSSSSSAPLWEGALIGKHPYLFPLPVATFFITLFLGIKTGQFVQGAPTL